jgi:hypothetical protein
MSYYTIDLAKLPKIVKDVKSSSELGRIEQRGGRCGLVECPICKKQRWLRLSAIIKPDFTGICSPCHGREMMKNGLFRGHNHTEQTKTRIRQYNKEHLENHNYWLGKHISEETKEKIANANSYKHTKEHNIKISKTLKSRNIKRSAETKQKIAQSTKNKWAIDEEYRKSHIEPNWGTPERKNLHIMKMRKGCHVRPTKPELLIKGILDSLFPNQYRYTGNGDMVVGGLIPDFWDSNSQKKVIECFGDYWHSDKVQGHSVEEETNLVKNTYARFGIDCLILWEHQLKDIGEVIGVIKEFHYKEHIK